MSRIKVILSIVLLAALVIIGIILPSYWRAGKQEKPTDSIHKPQTTEPNAGIAPDKNLKISYQGFDNLAAFFSKTRIEALKTLFPIYFNGSGQTITTVTFLPEKTEYPDGDSTKLYFSLSDGTELPVTCSTSSGAFFFGEEQTLIQTKDSSYERATDDTLPSYSTDDISSMQEGGYADTEDDTLPDEFLEESEAPQTETPAPASADAATEEEVLP